MIQKSKRQIGAAGEREARGFLESKGMRHRASNYQTRFGEIDLVMEDRGVLVFVEVKWRRGEEFGEPQESVTAQKRRRLVLAALRYVQRADLTDKMMRFDVVSIGPRGIEHLENAFEGGDDFYH